MSLNRNLIIGSLNSHHCGLSIVGNQSNGRTKRCNTADLKIKHPSEEWDLKLGTVGRAARFVNHPENLPDFNFIPDKIQIPNKMTLNQIKFMTLLIPSIINTV